MAEPSPDRLPLGNLVARGALLGALAPLAYLALSQAVGLAGALATRTLELSPYALPRAALSMVVSLTLAVPGLIPGGHKKSPPRRRRLELLGRLQVGVGRVAGPEHDVGKIGAEQVHVLGGVAGAHVAQHGERLVGGAAQPPWRSLASPPG